MHKDKKVTGYHIFTKAERQKIKEKLGDDATKEEIAQALKDQYSKQQDQWAEIAEQVREMQG